MEEKEVSLISQSEQEEMSEKSTISWFSADPMWLNSTHKKKMWKFDASLHLCGPC